MIDLSGLLWTSIYTLSDKALTLKVLRQYSIDEDTLKFCLCIKYPDFLNDLIIFKDGNKNLATVLVTPSTCFVESNFKSGNLVLKMWSPLNLNDIHCSNPFMHQRLQNNTKVEVMPLTCPSFLFTLIKFMNLNFLAE